MVRVPVRNKITINQVDAINPDIIKAIHENVPQSIKDTRGDFSQSFRGSSRLASAFNVWRFLRNEIRYQRDPNHTQMIRLPGRLLHDRTGDCKSYSLLAASILKNLGYPVILRYVSYKKSSNIPTHIYVITLDKDNSPIIVDGTYKKFNAECPFYSKTDVLIK